MWFKNSCLLGTVLLICLPKAFIAAQAPEKLTLEHCQKMAAQHYPLIQQYDLIEKMVGLDQDNIQQTLRPLLSVFGQATYQSEVTSLPIEIPGTGIPKISHDQYKFYGEAVQSLTDHKLVQKRKELSRAQAEVDRKKVDVALYQLRDKVDELFFATLMLDQQIALLELVEADINAGMASLETAIENELAIFADRSHLQAEKIALDQQRIELSSKRSATIEVLQVLIHQPITSSTVFILPDSIRYQQTFVDQKWIYSIWKRHNTLGLGSD